jgi:hypothetical protein
MNECTSWTTELQASFIISSLISHVLGFKLAPEVVTTRLLGCLCDITRVEYDCDRLILYC